MSEMKDIKWLLIADSMTIVERLAATLKLNETQKRIVSRTIAVALSYTEQEGEESEFIEMMEGFYKMEGKLDDE